jgi:hypothetical protein
MKPKIFAINAARDVRAAPAIALYQLRCRCARLPWKDLEAEAIRQGCTAADVFFDWAGRDLPVCSHRDRMPG